MNDGILRHKSQHHFIFVGMESESAMLFKDLWHSSSLENLICKMITILFFFFFFYAYLTRNLNYRHDKRLEKINSQSIQKSLLTDLQLLKGKVNSNT